MNKATSLIKKVSGQIAAVKSATTNAIANIKRGRELSDYENDFTK